MIFNQSFQFARKYGNNNASEPSTKCFEHYNTQSHRLCKILRERVLRDIEMTPVAYFTGEDNPRLGKPSLKFNGSLVYFGITSFVKWTTSHHRRAYRTQENIYVPP